MVQEAFSIVDSPQEALLRRRMAELTTVTEVSAAVTQILDVQEVLQLISDLAKERFNLYHVHIYLLDENGEFLNLAAGAGEPGRMMLERGHRIAADHPHSLVATAARTKQPVIVNDVTQTPDFLPNPLLPRTRSEMALPMMITDHVIGVLDVQSDILDRFDSDDARIKSALAAQAAVAVENARRFTAVQLEQERRLRTVNDLQVVADVGKAVTTITDIDTLLTTVVNMAKERFSLYHVQIYLYDEAGEQLVLAAGSGDVGRIMMQQGDAISIHADTQIADAAREHHGVIDNDVRKDDSFVANPLLPDTRSEVSIPMLIGDHLIGVLDVQSERLNRFDPEDVRVKTSLGSQVAIAVENARRYEAEQIEQERRLRTVNDLQVVADVGKAVTTIMDIDTLLSTVVNMAKERFSLYHVHIYLYDPEKELLVMASGAGEAGRIMMEQKRQISLHANALVARAARERVGVISNDVASDPNFLPNPILPLTRAEMSIPMLLGDELIGVLDVQSERLNRFDPEDVRVKTSLGGQVSIAIQNARRYQAEQREQERRRRTVNDLQVVADVGKAITTITDIDEMLTTVVNMAKERFSLYHVHIYLFDEANERLILRSGAGEAGRIMRERQHSIPLRANSLVARTAREHEGVISNDVHRDPNFLPNPLLPETKAEMSIPMLIGDRLIGVLDVQSERLNRFDSEDVRVKTSLGGQVAIAVENARQYEAQQRAQTELLRLAEQQAEQERQTADRLREVDRLKSQFLANMSHELRTPLNSIIGYSEVLMDGDDGELSDEAQEDIRTIYDSGNHLLNLINEILDLAKIEAGEVQVATETFELGRLIQDVVQTSQVLIKGRPIRLSSSLPSDGVQVISDPLRVRQVATNLVSNALKFTASGSVTVVVEQKDRHFALIKVCDTGPGIGAEHRDEIFERFRQIDGSATRQVGGTGLGLSISRSLVEMLGGEIGVESALGEGSTFWFTVPLSQRQPA